MIDIKRFREEKNIKQKEICTILGIAQPYLSAIEKGLRPLNEEKFKLLYKQYGDIILGYKNPEVVINISSGETTFDEADNAYLVPLLPISAQGGSLNDYVVSVKNSECERIISPIKGADWAIDIAGDSMAPEYPAGSKILIKRVDHALFLEWGKVYVLDTANGVVIKELRPSETDGCVRCISLNPDQDKYSPFQINLANVYKIYRVVLLLSLK